MPLASYSEYHVGYTKVSKNATPRRVYDSRGDITNDYVLVPNFTSGNLYDGEIVFYAKDDKTMHDIFEFMLATPVKVGSAAAHDV